MTAVHQPFDRMLPTDSQPVLNARLDDLDLTLVQRHIATAQERGRYNGPTEPLAYLGRHHGIVDVGGVPTPTLAGILAFTPEPERWLTASGIDVAQFSGPAPRSTDLSFIEQVRGSIFAVVDRTAQILWDRSEHGYRIDGIQRLEEHAYPQVVLRELTVNALCHRDWSKAGSHVRVQIFPHCIEWISPGGLPEGVTIENLLEAQFSRNPALVTFMFQAGYIEGLGLGMDTVFGTLRDANTEPPRIRNAAHAFTIRVIAQSVQTNGARTDQTSHDRKATIRVLLAQRGPLTISELEALLGIQRRTIQRDLQALVQQGELQVLGATNNRRYHLPAETNL